MAEEGPENGMNTPDFEETDGPEGKSKSRKNHGDVHRHVDPGDCKGVKIWYLRKVKTPSAL